MTVPVSYFQQVHQVYNLCNFCGCIDVVYLRCIVSVHQDPVRLCRCEIAPINRSDGVYCVSERGRLLHLCVQNSGLYRIRLIQMRPEPDMAGFRNSNLAGAGFGNNLFSDHRTIGPTPNIYIISHKNAATPSIMLSAAIGLNRQQSSMLLLLRHCLPVFDEICGTAMNFVFFSPG